MPLVFRGVSPAKLRRMLRVNKRSGWVDNVARCPSPNCDERPEGVTVDLLVIHGISLPPGEFGGPWIVDLFTNCLDPARHPYFADIHRLQVSAHFLIRRDGHLIQFVPTSKRAWHAGISQFDGRERCNDFSIGIELEGVDDQAYAEPQYRQLARLTHAIQRAYPVIADDRIVGHSDVAPGRKTDPGVAFDWGQYRQLMMEQGA